MSAMPACATISWTFAQRRTSVSRCAAIGGSPRPPWIRIGTFRSAASSNTGVSRASWSEIFCARGWSLIPRAVVRRAEGRVAIWLVEAEHEGTFDPEVVHDPKELGETAGHAVDVVAEMDVRVEDANAVRKLGLQLVAPALEQLLRLLQGRHQRRSASRRSAGPTYRALGRISRPVDFCSTMWADQPAVRAQAKSAGVTAAGISASSSTIAPQNSTFVSSGRSGYLSFNAATAARSSASAASTRGEP